MHTYEYFPTQLQDQTMTHTRTNEGQTITWNQISEGHTLPLLQHEGRFTGGR